MNKTKRYLGSLALGIVGGMISIMVFGMVVKSDQADFRSAEELQPAQFTNMSTPPISSDNEKFINAAEKTVEGVVHVKTEATVNTYYNNPLYEFFYGERQREQKPVMGFGSGVIVSPEGYIVTNNHVIEKAEKISVTLNDNREFEAKLVGTDPNSDIALLKVEAEDIHFIPWGDSDDLRLGEWVLAVGNPFNLTSTVTAGIVSAKGRSLGIIKEQYRLESFIQTDAAVNQGNSGGALVNLNGELVGVNTAILSPSGAYSGTSFAVPVNIVKKIVEDLIQYGEVQRAILGVSIRDVTSELADEEDLGTITGAYVNGVAEDGAAEEAGIKKGDVIISVNGNEITNSSELQEQIGRYRPNQEVTVTVIRDKKKKQFDAVLRNMQGGTKIVKPSFVSQKLGAKFKNATDEEKEELGISNGVKIIEILPGKLSREGVQEGFIITKVNNQKITSVEQLEEIIEKIEGGVYIEGIYPDGVVAYYAFGM
jgi:Do/DeqQ family serine protease